MMATNCAPWRSDQPPRVMMPTRPALAMSSNTTTAFVAFDSAFSRLGCRICTPDPSIVRKGTRTGLALLRLGLGGLDVEPRQAAVEHPRQCPVGLAEQQHQPWNEDAAHDHRIEQDRRGERDAEQLDYAEAAEHEGAEHEHHDRGGRGDRAPGRGESVHHRLAVVAALVPLLVDAAHEE